MIIKNFVCLGYAKCGTTLLDTVFRKSSIVATPIEKKEIKFFLPPQYPDTAQYDRYLRHFFGNGATQNDARMTFEASPPYCHQTLEEFRHVLNRICETLPEPHAIMCFRHPVVRAYSHYIHNLQKFALHGDGVHGAQKLLPSRIFKRSFREMLDGRPRIRTTYGDYLEAAYEIMGRDRVTLFFLESDVLRFGQWVTALMGAEVTEELGVGNGPPERVIPRRPVPNYLVKDGVLIAFGSRQGELVHYTGIDDSRQKAILDSRKKWTLELDDCELKSVLQEYFLDDLLQCLEVSGDVRFSDYLLNPLEQQTATLVSGKVLKELHGIPSITLPNSHENKHKKQSDVTNQLPYSSVAISDSVRKKIKSSSDKGELHLLEGLDACSSSAAHLSTISQQNTPVGVPPLRPKKAANRRQAYDPASLAARAKGRIGALSKRLGVTPEQLSGARILELGCGIGEATAAAIELFAADAHGIDIKPSWKNREYEILEKEGRLHLLDLADAEVLRLGDFDYIHSYTVFEHIMKPKEALSNLFFLLKPGGRAFLNFYLYPGASAAHLLGFLPDKPWIHLTHTDEEARKIMRDKYKLDRGICLVNKWKANDYLQTCKEIGFNILKHWFVRKEPEAAFVADHPQLLEQFSLEELSKNAMNLVLERP